MLKKLNRINRNNFTLKRIKIEINKKLIDSGLIEAQENYTKFIILARSRVGSNLLISYLNSHPSIYSMGELFGNNHSKEVIEYRAKHPLEYLQSNCFRKYDRKILAVGFKIFYYHPVKNEPKTIWKILEEMKGLKVIHLTRENLLRTHLSKEIASLTDIWAETGNSLPLKKRVISIAKKSLLKTLEETKNWEKEFTEIFRNHSLLHIKYEDLINNPAQELAKAQEFIGLPVLKLHTSLKKQNPESLRTLISNYDELKKEFENSRWDYLFEE